MKQFLQTFWKEHFYGDVHAVHIFNYVLFCAFTLLFLFGLQRDLLQLLIQSYWGTAIAAYIKTLLFVLLFLLLGVKLLLNKILKLKGRYHALSFVPLFVALIFITILVPKFSILKGGILGFILLLYITGISHLGRGTNRNDNFLTMLLPNLFTFLISFLIVTLMTNTKDTFHQELKMEKYLNHGKIDAALKVAEEEHYSSQRLLALRAYALARKNALAEQLFEYSVCPTEDLFLHDYDAPMMIFPLDEYKSFIGWLPHENVTINTLEEHIDGMNSTLSPLRDYWLCTLLIKKDLKNFALWLPRLYDTKKKLPRYYGEAMMLYKPSWKFHDAQIEMNYADYKDKWNQIKDNAERRKKLYDLYGNTYWWYFHFV